MASQRPKRQAATCILRQKTDSKSKNHLRLSRRCKITSLRRGSLADAEDDDGFVVEAVLRALETGDVGEDGVGDLLGGVLALGAEKAG